MMSDEKVENEAVAETAVNTEEEKTALGESCKESADGKNSETGTVPAVSAGENEQSEEDMKKHDLAVLEGLLYIVGDEGLTVDQACNALERKPEECEALFDELQKEYQDDRHGIEVARFGDTWRFLSKESVHENARKLFSLSGNTKLSQAALETLAIIAYKQPITRVEIEEIRGVGADMMLRKLMARNLIRESGRSDAPGKPILYEVTEEFMNSFKLMSLKELPDLPTFHDDAQESEDLFRQ